MGLIRSFTPTKDELDKLLKSNHKALKTVYKYKKITSNADIHYTSDNSQTITIRNSLDYSLRIMNEHQIYVPTRNEVNDPFEGEMIHSNLCVSGSWYDRVQKKISEIAISDLSKYRFLSLSSKANIPQMWSYYTDTFHGICFIFSTAKAFKNYENILYLEPKTQNFPTITEPSPQDRHLLAYYNLLLKSPEWQSEREVRIITDSNTDFINFHKDELIGVILGHNIDENSKAQIISAAENNGVSIYKTYLDSLALKVDILPYYFDASIETGSGEDLEDALHRWRNSSDENKTKYPIDIDGQLIS